MDIARTSLIYWIFLIYFTLWSELGLSLELENSVNHPLPRLNIHTTPVLQNDLRFVSRAIYRLGGPTRHLIYIHLPPYRSTTLYSFN